MVTGQLMLFTSILPLLIVYFLFVFFPSEDAFKAPQRSVDKPFRLCVSDVFKGNVKYGNGPLMSIFLMSVFISPICVWLLRFCWRWIFSSQTRVQASVLQERSRLVIFKLETKYWQCLQMKPALSKVCTHVLFFPPLPVFVKWNVIRVGWKIKTLYGSVFSICTKNYQMRPQLFFISKSVSHGLTLIQQSITQHPLHRWKVYFWQPYSEFL